MSSHTAASARKSQPPEASRHHIREEADLASKGQSLSAPTLAAPSAQNQLFSGQMALTTLVHSFSAVISTVARPAWNPPGLSHMPLASVDLPPAHA